jgi:hypothetical protein
VNGYEKTTIESKKQYVLQTESSYPYLQDKIVSNAATETKDEPSSEEQLLRDTFLSLEDKIGEAIRSWPAPAKSTRPADHVGAEQPELAQVRPR